MNTQGLETNTQTIERLTGERDSARAAVAEMRDLAMAVWHSSVCWKPNCYTVSAEKLRSLADKANNETVGTGWLSPEVAAISASALQDALGVISPTAHPARYARIKEALALISNKQ